MPELYRVFVSHAARDRCIAERIAEALRARGARPFLDVYDIEKGDNILETIRKELNRADELVAYSHRRLNEPGFGLRSPLSGGEANASWPSCTM
jgi:hypothetical protein